VSTATITPVLCACGCGLEVPPKKGRSGGPRIYAAKRCAQRAYRKVTPERFRMRNRRFRTTPTGRVCKWCQATDSEADFDSASECVTCFRLRGRRACKTCSGPAALWGCGTCSTPTGLVKVRLLDAESDRERVVYRAKIRNTNHIVVPAPDEGEELLITMPTPLWVRTRR